MPAQSQPRDLATLVATRVRVERGLEVICNDISLIVGPEHRVGIVGPNGVGKSTFLNALAGRLPLDGGSVELVPAQGTVGYLAQEHERRPDESVTMYLARQTGAVAAEQELVDAASALGDGTEAANDRYSLALDRWSSLGLDTLEGRTATVLSDLGLDEGILELPTSALSGGQAARVALAAVLLSRFAITLLDEPTNDLDFDGLERLERFVNARRGGLVIVSHDRSFLERTVNAILEIDEHDHRGRVFEGGYEAFLAERATSRRHAEESYATYAGQRAELLARARREREWATAGAAKEKKAPKDNDSMQRGFRMNRTEKLAGRARMTERALQRLETVDKPWEGWELRFAIENAPRSGTVVFRLDDAVVHRGAFVLGPVSLEVNWAERVALVGPNGSGKSSLLAALLGRLRLDRGSRYIGPSVVIGELGQDRARYGTSQSVLEVFVQQTGLITSEARSLLAKFGIGAGHVERPGSSLSPGERTRAELAAFQATGVNLLVLDEPTNHLDLPAIEQLEDALAAYTGTLLLVSHDRRLLDSIDIDRTIDVSAIASSRE